MKSQFLLVVAILLSGCAQMTQTYKEVSEKATTLSNAMDGKKTSKVAFYTIKGKKDEKLLAVPAKTCDATIYSVGYTVGYIKGHNRSLAREVTSWSQKAKQTKDSKYLKFIADNKDRVYQNVPDAIIKSIAVSDVPKDCKALSFSDSVAKGDWDGYSAIADEFVGSAYQ